MLKPRLDRSLRPALLLVVSVVAVACAPEVGSQAWCDQMKETPKGDWSANDAAAFTKHCLFR